MAYSITKQPDGDVNLGSMNGEFVVLQPSTSDYSTGGYAVIDGESVVNNPLLNANVDMYKVLTAQNAGATGGYFPVWDQNAKKVIVYRQSAATGALAQVPSNFDLSAQSFYLLLIGL